MADANLRRADLRKLYKNKMVRSKAIARRQKPYRKYKPDYPLSTGMARIAYCRSVIQMNWDGGNNISGEFDHGTNLGNNLEYAGMAALWRKGCILKASCTFMPSNLTANAQAPSSNFVGPLMIAPYYGNYVGTALSYSRLGQIPGCIVVNPIETTTQRRAYWYKKRDLDDYDIHVPAAGRSLDDYYGGFLVFADGVGFTTGQCAGHLLITWKVMFKDPRHVS